MEKEKAAREYEELKRSMEANKSKIAGMPTVAEARESYEQSVAGSKNSGRFTSTNPVRISHENPIEDLPEIEVARNNSGWQPQNKPPANNIPENEEEEYYDEECDYYDEEDDLEGSKGSKNSKLRRKLSDSSKSLGKVPQNKLGAKP